MRPRAWAWLAGAVVAALGATTFVTPAQSMPVRAFGAPISIAPPVVDVYGPSMAVLPDGTVGVAWTSTLNTVRMAIRRPGTNTFVTLTPLTLTDSIVTDGPSASWPVVTLRPAGSEFLLGWGESMGGSVRVRVARVAAAATAVPAPATVSGGDSISSVPVAFGTATDGSAVAAWGIVSPFGFEIRAARRAGTSGAWQQLGDVGVTSLPFDLVAGIDSSRSVTVAWIQLSGALIDVKVRSRRGDTWSPVLVAGSVTPSGLAASRLVDVETSGTATALAFVDIVSGTSGYSVDAVARGIRVLHRPTPTSPWTMSGSLVGPGRYAASPSLAMTPGGGAVVRFLDLRDGTAPPWRTASTMLAQRTTLGGPWSAARLVEAVSVDSSIDDITMARMDPVLAGDGTAVMLLPAPYAAGGGTVALGASTTWRTGWGTAFTEQPTLPARPYTQMTTGMVLDPAGRATLTYIDDTTFGLVAATTALPKPFARTRAALSSASPRVGVAVTCKSAWTGAKTLAFRWLRGGSAIARATSKTYVPKAADRDRGLSCRVTATNPTGSTVTTSVARTVGG